MKRSVTAELAEANALPAEKIAELVGVDEYVAQLDDEWLDVGDLRASGDELRRANSWRSDSPQEYRKGCRLARPSSSSTSSSSCPYPSPPAPPPPSRRPNFPAPSHSTPKSTQAAWPDCPPPTHQPRSHQRHRQARSRAPTSSSAQHASHPQHERCRTLPAQTRQTRDVPHRHHSSSSPNSAERNRRADVGGAEPGRRESGTEGSRRKEEGVAKPKE